MELTKKEEKELRFKELKKALKSKDNKELSKTLKDIESKDDIRLLMPLIELGKRNENEKIELKITKLLFDLKLTKGHSIILNELKDGEPSGFRSILISTIWNANIQALDYLDVFVKIAIEGSFLESIECLTVIEETEGEVVEEQVLESLILLREFLQNNSDSDKKTIIEDILRRVEDIERMHQ